MKLATLAAVAAAFGAAGCATIARGGIDRYSIASQPPGALATASVGGSCRTPCTLDIGRRDAFTVTLALAGYRARTIQVGTQVSSAGASHAFENVVNAGSGLAVDALTGATLELVRGQFQAVLTPL